MPSVSEAHPLAHQFSPQGFYFLILGKEAMATDIESEALILNRARETADVLGILLQHYNPTPFSREFIARGETRRSGTYNDDIALRLGIQNSRGPPTI